MQKPSGHHGDHDLDRSCFIPLISGSFQEVCMGPLVDCGEMYQSSAIAAHHSHPELLMHAEFGA